jgi:hypothetical protein
MSWRKELREIRRERDDLMRRGTELRRDLKWQFANALVYFLIADQVVSLIGRLIGGQPPRRTTGRSRKASAG